MVEDKKDELETEKGETSATESVRAFAVWPRSTLPLTALKSEIKAFVASTRAPYRMMT